MTHCGGWRVFQWGRFTKKTRIEADSLPATDRRRGPPSDAHQDPFAWRPPCPFVVADLLRGDTHPGGSEATPEEVQPQPPPGCTQPALATAAAPVPHAAARRRSLVIVAPRPARVAPRSSHATAPAAAKLAKAQGGAAIPLLPYRKPRPVAHQRVWHRTVDTRDVTPWRGLLACSSARLIWLSHAARPCSESCRHLPLLPGGGPARLRTTGRRLRRGIRCLPVLRARRLTSRQRNLALRRPGTP